MKTALTTGVTGQDGSFLAELLLSKDAKADYPRLEIAQQNSSTVCGKNSCDYPSGRLDL
jgi:GDP-D-mannose dehydratase